MLVIGRLDDTGPTALKGSLAIYPWGVAPGWYEPGPSALLKGAHPLQSWRLHHRGSEARQGKTQQEDAFPLMALVPHAGRNSNHAADIKERIHIPSRGSNFHIIRGKASPKDATPSEAALEFRL